MEPKWSPDGQRIAFMSTLNGLPDLYVMDADGKNVLRLSEFPSQVDMPSESFQAGQNWSPDGERIVFLSTRGEASRDIYTMRADGSNLLRLTDHEASDNNPTWSPDGEKIAFAALKGHKRDIYVYHLDAGVVEQVTDDRYDDNNPSWLPNSN